MIGEYQCDRHCSHAIQCGNTGTAR
jgi:hypothetical protein